MFLEDEQEKQRISKSRYEEIYQFLYLLCFVSIITDPRLVVCIPRRRWRVIYVEKICNPDSDHAWNRWQRKHPVGIIFKAPGYLIVVTKSQTNNHQRNWSSIQSNPLATAANHTAFLGQVILIRVGCQRHH